MKKKSVENLKTLVLSCKDVNNHSLTDFVILEFAYSAYMRKYFVNSKVVLLCLSINVNFLIKYDVKWNNFLISYGQLRHFLQVGKILC